MLDILERREGLLKEAEKLQRNLFWDGIRKLEKEYSKENLHESVKETFVKLCRRWTAQSDRIASSLGITYLYSSVLMRTYQFKVTLYGEEFYLDNDSVECFWRPPCFFEIFEEDMAVVIKQLKKVYPRLCRCEEDAIRYQCVEYYYAALYKLCVDIIEEILNRKEFVELNKTTNFFVFFGKIKGEGEILLKCSSE